MSTFQSFSIALNLRVLSFIQKTKDIIWKKRFIALFTPRPCQSPTENSYVKTTRVFSVTAEVLNCRISFLKNILAVGTGRCLHYTSSVEYL